MNGKGAHGSKPWTGVDPIAASAQIIQGLQNIVSRQMELTKAPVVITIGAIHGGVRNNIIPESCEMIGTLMGNCMELWRETSTSNCVDVVLAT